MTFHNFEIYRFSIALGKPNTPTIFFRKRTNNERDTNHSAEYYNRSNLFQKKNIIIHVYAFLWIRITVLKKKKKIE